MKGKNSDRALVHLDASIYFYLKWAGKWAIAGCKAIVGTPWHTTSITSVLLFWFMNLTLTIDHLKKMEIIQNQLTCRDNMLFPKNVFLKFFFWKASPQASDRRTIKGWTVFKIKVVFAAAVHQAISNKTSAVEKWLDKIKQWTPIVVQ